MSIIDDFNNKLDKLASIVGSYDASSFCLENEIDYSKFTYTRKGLYRHSMFWGSDMGWDASSGNEGNPLTDNGDGKYGYCINGNYVHVNIIIAQGGDYQANRAYIGGFPKPAFDRTLHPGFHIRPDSDHDYQGGILINGNEGKLVMSAANVYADQVHYQFTYRKG